MIFIDNETAFKSPQEKVVFQMEKKQQKTFKDLKETFCLPLCGRFQTSLNYLKFT
jgi:hypothetical protein